MEEKKSKGKWKKPALLVLMRPTEISEKILAACKAWFWYGTSGPNRVSDNDCTSQWTCSPCYDQYGS